MTECLDFLRVDFPRKAVAPKPAAAPKLRIPSAPSSIAAVIGSGSGSCVVKKSGRPAAVQAPPVAAGKGIDKFFGGGKTASPVGASMEGKRSREDREDEEAGDVVGAMEGVETLVTVEEVVEGDGDVDGEEDTDQQDVFAADGEE